MNLNFQKRFSSKPRDVLVIQLSTYKAMWAAILTLVMITLIFFLGLWVGSSSSQTNNFRSAPPSSNYSNANSSAGVLPMPPMNGNALNSPDSIQTPHSFTGESPKIGVEGMNDEPVIPPNPQVKSMESPSVEIISTGSSMESVPRPPDSGVPTSNSRMNTSIESSPLVIDDPVKEYLSSHRIPKKGPYAIKIATHNNQATAQDTCDYLNHRNFATQVKPVLIHGKSFYQIVSKTTYPNSNTAIRALIHLTKTVKLAGIKNAIIVSVS